MHHFFMRTALLFAFGFSVTQCVLSQPDSVQHYNAHNKYAVTLAPAFFAFGQIGLQPGFQFKIGDNYSLMTEIGFPVLQALEKSYSFQEVQILKLTTELKYYPKKSLLHGRFYSLQLGYVHRNFIDEDSGTYHNPRTVNVIGYTRLTIKSPICLIALKWGRELVEWKKTFLDCFLGFGIRIIPTKYYTEGTYVVGQWHPPVDNMAAIIPIPAWEYDKTITRPHFSLGLRIGRKF